MSALQSLTPSYVLCLGRKRFRRALVRAAWSRGTEAIAAEPANLGRLLRERGLPSLIVADALENIRMARQIVPRLYFVPATVSPPPARKPLEPQS
jgi:hypothetical protein